MATLIKENKDNRAKNAIGSLLDNMASMGAQLVQAEKAIGPLKTKVKKAAANDKFVLADLVPLIQNLERQKSILEKYASIKTQFVALKKDLLNPEHKTELQVEIDKI